MNDSRGTPPRDPSSPMLMKALMVVWFVVLAVMLTAVMIGLQGEAWTEKTAIPKLVAIYDIGMVGLIAYIWRKNCCLPPEKKSEWTYYFIGITFTILPWIGFERIDEIWLIAPFLLIGMGGLVAEALNLYRKSKPKT